MIELSMRWWNNSQSNSLRVHQPTWFYANINLQFSKGDGDVDRGIMFMSIGTSSIILQQWDSIIEWRKKQQQSLIYCTLITAYWYLTMNNWWEVNPNVVPEIDGLSRIRCSWAYRTGLRLSFDCLSSKLPPKNIYHTELISLLNM
jgi:hypothetical protein